MAERGWIVEWERIWTVPATCKQQSRNVFDFIQQLLLVGWTNQCYACLAVNGY